ncbi:type I methionyl aminopeptidase [candidate division TA06 bacterium B3_TA06]|uniref:Methionine aminopeptidase n=1 Tax=candidate division TA06 bacterium B3_TA06 TaxID=2012487 RepID=A0A532V474_UNCT6|nr:MAG: type I methionyl aminopeptidase [candidate division TA06 bacterium B3_TA06]
MSGIVIKSDAEIEGIRRAGRILARALDLVSKKALPGCTTAVLDAVIEEFIRSQGAEPTFKGYRGFPAAACISINEEVIHGIPGDRVIKEGDLVKVDAGVTKDGFIADSARSIPVGDVNGDVKRLMEVTSKALQAGIKQARPGNRVGDISHAVEEVARAAGLAVVRDYFGHGTGLALHEEPNIPNFGPAGVGPRLQEGMTIAIEPMLTLGIGKVKLCEDRWTVVTADGKSSAHFEHTIAVTENGAEILTSYV